MVNTTLLAALFATTKVLRPVKLLPSPWNEPLNEPEPPLDKVLTSANDAVASTLNIVALAATDDESEVLELEDKSANEAVPSV